MNTEAVAIDIARILVENGFFRRLCANCKSTGGALQSQDNSKDTLSFSLRGDCHSLVKDIAETWNIDERIIYGTLKKVQGVSQPVATDEQLSERVDILREWLDTGVCGR